VPALVGKQALTAVFPVRGESATLSASIEAVSAALGAKLRAAESIHSARFVLLDGRDSGATLLLLATVFDGGAGAHLAELWSHGALELGQVLRHCAGWARPSTPESFERFVRAHARPVAALFSAQLELSVPQIRADFALRSALSRWLSEHDPALRALSPLEIVRRAAERFGVTHAGAGGRVDEEERGGTGSRQLEASRLTLREWAALGLTFLRSCVHDLGDLFGGLWHDTLTSSGSAPALAPEPTGTSGGLRAFSHAAELKTGRFRRSALRLVLRLLAKFARAASASGKVRGAEAVQSAGFMLLEDGRLLFWGDFDVSLESVLERAAERARGLVGMIWSHTLGFPLSFGWYQGGARDVARLRDFARHGELRTPFRFSGYPELGARQIHENAEIRRLLSEAVDETGARRLLSLVRD
jgi:hypothetical protein